MTATIFERMLFLANGGASAYLHKNGRENQQTTKLQNFLSVAMKRTSVSKDEDVNNLLKKKH